MERWKIKQGTVLDTVTGKWWLLPLPTSLWTHTHLASTTTTTVTGEKGAGHNF